MKVIYKNGKFSVKKDENFIFLYFGKYRTPVCNLYNSKKEAVWQVWNALKNMIVHGNENLLYQKNGIEIFNAVKNYIDSMEK